MSKRQSGTYTTRTGGNLVRVPKPLTQGKALILAREILGPEARVVWPSGCSHSIWLGDQTIAFGPSWEKALEVAKGSPEAKAWEGAKLLVDNSIAHAVNSLAIKQVEVMKGRIARAKELTESAFKKRKVFTTRKVGGKTYRVGKTYGEVA